MAETFYQLLNQALQRNSKSTVLRALTGLFGLLLTAIICAPRLNAESWVVMLLAIMLVITFLVFIVAYVYFALTNPELLRSEKYVIQKMAIEQGLIGDDISGYIKIDPKNQKLITGSSESTSVKVE